MRETARGSQSPRHLRLRPGVLSGKPWWRPARIPPRRAREPPRPATARRAVSGLGSRTRVTWVQPCRLLLTKQAREQRGCPREPETGRAGSLQHNPAPPSTPANRLFIKRKQRHVFGKLFDQGQWGFERGGRWLSACPPPGRASAAKTWPACCPAGAAWGREPGKLPSRAGSEGAAPRQRRSLRGRAESSAWKQWEVTQERALRWQTMPFSKSCFCKTSLRQIPGKWPSDTEPS